MEDALMENTPKTPKTHLNYGLLTGIILVVLFVLYYAFNLVSNTALGLIPAVIFMALVIFAQISHAKAVEGDITYGNLFAMGFKTAAVATCIYVLFLIIFLLLVPGYKDQMMEASREKMVAKGGMTEDQINMAIGWTRKSFTLLAVGGAIIGNLIIGCIAALIGAAIAKKNPGQQVPGM